MVLKDATRNMLIEHGTARVQASPERRLIWPALTQQGLQRHGLVSSLNLGMVGWAALAGEADVNPQGQELEMQAGRKRRR